MFCNKCGKEIEEESVFCNYCGNHINTENTRNFENVNKKDSIENRTKRNGKEDEIFCPECGKLIKRNAVVCVNCGVSLKDKKSKTAAIVLAIFFNFWSWLYTYKKDYKKFWIYLPFMTLNVVLAEVSFFVPSIRFDYGTWITLYSYLVWGSAWIWAVLNSTIRPRSFYSNYPKG